MTKLKMILVLILSVLVLFAGNVYASTPNVTITLDKSEVEIGDTFEVTISASAEDAIDGLSSKIEYNENVLEKVSSELIDSDNWSDLDTFPNLVATWKTIGTEKTSADIYKITFKVKDNIEAQDIEIKLSDVILSHTGGQENLEDITKTITIKAKGNNNPSDDGNNDNTGDNDNKDNDNTGDNKDDNNNNEEDNNDNNNGDIGDSEENGEDSSDIKNSGSDNLELKSGSSKVLDSTTSQKEIPYAGEWSKIIAILIVVFTALGVNGYVLYKKYKNI